MALGPSLLMKRRMTVILAVFVFAGFAALTARLFYLQVIAGDYYSSSATFSSPRSAARSTTAT